MLIGPKNFKIIKKEKGEKSYLDIETKRREFVPPPGQYMSQKDWKKEMESYQSGGSPSKGKFLKGNKVTTCEEIFLKGKKNSMPEPCSYSPKLLDKITGLSKVKEEKGQFVEESKFVGMQTPGFIYEASVAIVKPKIFTTKIYPDKKGPQDAKPKKTDEPAPGSYNVDNSYLKTQWSQRLPQFSKLKNKTFVDDYKKQKDWLPGVGTYKEVEKGYSKLSFNPPSIKTKRH